MPEKLSPTPDAASLHSRRVHLQIITWETLEDVLNPTYWGWYNDHGMLKPIRLDGVVAPDNLLKFVR